MRGFGVKDGERDAFVAWIEAAFADGQIGEADRDLRLSRARGAETSDELQTLTRDLRPVAARPGGVAQPPMVRVGRTRHAGGALVGLGVFLLVVVVGVAGVVALLAMAVGPSEPTSDSVVGAGGSGEVSPAVVVDGALDARQLRAVLRSYPERFGTPQAVQLAIADGNVTATVPVRGDGPSAQMWAWTGDWERLTARAPTPRDVATVDLRTLDVRALVRNVEVARAALGADARVLRVVVADAGSGARVRVELLGTDTAGTLVTTLPGRVVRGVQG